MDTLRNLFLTRTTDLTLFKTYENRGGIDDSPTLIIQDSVYGLINATDGWFSVFYPIGNPFSAAIQNPMDALMMGVFGYSTDPLSSTDPNFRLQPIQP